MTQVPSFNQHLLSKVNLNLKSLVIKCLTAYNARIFDIHFLVCFRKFDLNNLFTNKA